MGRVPRVLCLAALSLQAVAALAQTMQCERLSPQKGELAYRLRGAYCEGLFIQDTSSSVRLKGLVAVYPGTTSGAKTMRAVPLTPSPAGYRMRVQSLDPGIHYQLDALVPASGGFQWPTEIVDKAGLQRTQLAPLVWTQSKPAAYVPVSLDPPPAAQPVMLRAIFESSVPVTDYVASLTAEQGGAGIALTSRSALPATVLEFDLPRSQPGRHTFWLRVRLLGEAQPESQNWLLALP
jgi:hypothetical protein